VLMRRAVLEELEGYDPEILIWANELEFMLRFFDRGYRHLHLPEVVAQHMKPVLGPEDWIRQPGYRTNARHFAYVAAKHLRRRDAVEVLIALLARAVGDAVRTDRVAFRALPDTVSGFVAGLRHREPVRNPRVSRLYRRNFGSFASPWWFFRTPGELVRDLPREIREAHRPPVMFDRDRYYVERSRYYPQRSATLQL
jgi:GT2 family glycosyltransferase